MVVCVLLFTGNITVLIRQVVASHVLLLEKRGQVTFDNIIIEFAGHTGIFDTEADTRGDVDG